MGFTTLLFVKPSVDGLGSPSLNDRTERGDGLDVQVLLRDNTLAPVISQQVVVTLVGTDVSIVLTTFANGTAAGVLSIPNNQSVGFNDLEVPLLELQGQLGSSVRTLRHNSLFLHRRTSSYLHHFYPCSR